jgi:protein-S-isoprenylcysteine O-methyltransferase Ste14
LGAVLMISALRAFSRAGTPVDPYEPARALATDGPYRFTRNPIYLGFALVYLGFAIVLNALWAVALLPVVVVVVDRGVIAREERYLERRFGEDYRAYKAHVRRWV